jgi:hypothetical protein
VPALALKILLALRRAQIILLGGGAEAKQDCFVLAEPFIALFGASVGAFFLFLVEGSRPMRGKPRLGVVSVVRLPNCPTPRDYQG